MTDQLDQFGAAAERIDDDVLRVALAEAVAGVAGVARLEPTLKNVISRFADRAARAGETAPSAPVDGVTLTRYGQITDVKIDIAVDGQARSIATAVQDRVRTALVGYGCEPGVITVHVVALEQPGAGQD